MFIALCSVKGSPGVTILAATLAMHWPNPEGTRRLVAELDPAGGDLAVRAGLRSTPGLVSLAAAARHTHDPGVVWEHTQPLPGGARVLLAPPSGVHTRAALTTLGASGGTTLHATARAPGVVLLADCGRVDPGSPVEMFARRADALVLLSGTEAEDLAHTAARASDLARWTPRSALLLTGTGYPSAEVERELGIPAIGRLPHDPAAAALTGHQSSSWRSRRPGSLARTATALARTLSATLAPTAPAVPVVSPRMVASRDGAGAVHIPPGLDGRVLAVPPRTSAPPRRSPDSHPAGMEASS